MATNSISSKVITAASVSLSKPIQVFGVNTYTITTDFISWGEGNSYSLSDIAGDFGVRTTGVGDKVFTCGDDKISVYDFGLLFTVFTAMNSAQTELGSGFNITESVTSKEGIRALWIGNDVIIYSQVNNLILPLDNADVKRLCSGERLECANFCTKDRYTVDRERVELFVVDAAKHELVCRTRISDAVQKCYAKCFEQPDSEKDSLASWDTESRLGRLIASVNTKLPVKKLMDSYKKSGMIETVNNRREIFSDLGDPLGMGCAIAKMFGNVFYTDKAEVIIAVNMRAGMLVYTPYFAGDATEGLLLDPRPAIDSYYNVTDQCDQIARFANTVIYRPLTAAQFDAKVFGTVANSWADKKLQRLSFASALGRVVIPESILEDTLDVGFGADLFCFVPVGQIGEAVICKTATGNLDVMYQTGWSTSDAFYDITEVIADAQHR